MTSTSTLTRTVDVGTSTTTVRKTATPTSSQTPRGPYSDPEFRSAVLNSTNYFRARYLASPLVWDSTLAKFAHDHAQKCIFQHSGGPYGENLAEGFTTPALGVDAWAAEEKHYRYPNGGFSESTGHFTQLVWQNTTHLGCGAVNCGSQDDGDGAFGWYLVCEYSPPGNVIGEFQYNIQKPGESADGELGFGAMSGVPQSPGRSRILGILVAMSLLASCWVY